ncbi:hypothetical protein Tsubulata_034210, partial [Turnera subulata]
MTNSELLVRVKNSELQDPNGSLNNWVITANDPISPCNWTGITCDDGIVISLDLSGLNLGGQFPFGFCKLTSLRNLSLSLNNFNGSVDGKVLSSSCSHLRVMQLDHNNLEGELPVLWPGLEVLDLSSNSFSGDVPGTYGQLLSLRVFYLSSNLLNCSFPAFLTNLTELSSLGLGDNPFKPSRLPEDIGNLGKLEELLLASSNLVGEIPDSIGRMVRLNELDLSKNSLTGNLPQKVAAMQLQRLNLYENFLSGEIPEVLASNPNLVRLNLYNNNFTGKLPTNLGLHSDLEDFDVSTNSFSGQLPPYLCHRKSLKRIVAFKNHFSGNLPESYGGCTSLEYVMIQNNNLFGPVPSKFWSLPRLQHLQISGNSFEGSISSSISGAKGLAKLFISTNNFSGGLPVEVCKLHGLTQINLSGNRFRGELLSCLTELKGLQSLEMQDNNFSGEVPSSFNLSGNRFTGRIPPGLGNLPVLTDLDLSRNEFTGEIPESLTKLKLSGFNLSNNQLYGNVPVGFLLEYYIPGLLGNPNLCSPHFKPFPPCANSKPFSSLYIAVAVAAVSVLCILLLLGYLFYSCFLLRRKLVLSEKPNAQFAVTRFQQVGFDEHDILSSLTEENLIGSGGSGQVYRVDLTPDQVVAAKRLRSDGSEGTRQFIQAESFFRSEAETLGRIRHRNILKLLMSCSGGGNRVLVFEYMENGSLGDVLHGAGEGLADWHLRLMIAQGIAHGLAYLHHDCVPAIIHRDVKSNNILLDAEMRPRLADFGLAKTLLREAATTSGIVGSYGYIAPDTSNNKSGELIDPKIQKSSLNYGEFEMVLDIALLCTSSVPTDRPSMRQ